MGAFTIRPRALAASSSSSTPSVLASSFNRPSLARSIPCVYRLPPHRHAATARRTAKKFRIAASPSGRPVGKRQALQSSIIFHPPPTAPSPYHTPPLFLPASDPRRTLLAAAHAHVNPFRRSNDDGRNAADVVDTADLPPAIGQPPTKTYTCGPAEVAEIRRLRASNPWVWTRKRLAEKFGCSEYFVGMCAQAPPSRLVWHQQNLERVKERWGGRRTHAREERSKRRELWARDE